MSLSGPEIWRSRKGNSFNEPACTYTYGLRNGGIYLGSHTQLHLHFRVWG